MLSFKADAAASLPTGVFLGPRSDCLEQRVRQRSKIYRYHTYNERGILLLCGSSDGPPLDS